MKKVAFVPIKLNNERLPNKNIKCFENGEPLITYILDTLKKVNNLDEIYVYCSDESVKKYLPYGIKFLKRSDYLDRSDTPFNEVLISFAKEIKADIYVLTHATAPFIKAESIEKAIEAVENNGYDSSISVKKIQEFLWEDNKPMNYFVDNIPRTQDLKPIYIETCGLYVYTSKVINEKLCRIGDKPFLICISDIEAIDINTKSDFEIANAIYNNIINIK